MNLPISVRLVCVLAFGSGGMFPDLHGAVLQRGPYLQIATPDSITVRWRTDVACEGVVHYGTQTNLLASATSDLNTTTNHEVRLTGLTPSTQYFYSIGSSNEALAVGADCNFITFPPPGQARPTRVWVIGDAGQAPELTQTTMRDAYYQYTGSRHTDVCLALGDNCLTFGGGRRGTPNTRPTSSISSGHSSSKRLFGPALAITKPGEVSLPAARSRISISSPFPPTARRAALPPAWKSIIHSITPTFTSSAWTR